MSHPTPSSHPTSDAAETVLATARAVVRREAAGVAACEADLDDTFLQVVQLAYECTGKVFVTGAGTSGAVARRMAHLLSVSGTPAMYIPGADALHGTMGAMTSGDVLIAISRGGSSQEINDLVARAKERGVSAIVALTADPESELARRSDIVVRLTMLAGIDPGEVIAMGSTLVTAAWGDALATVLMQLRGYSWPAVLHSHPSGAVGQVQEAPEALPPLEKFWA